MDTPRQGIDGFVEDVHRLRSYMEGEHPLYARALAGLADALDTDRLQRFAEAWADRSFPMFYERPLLVLAVLRFEALRRGTSHPLHGPLVRAEAGGLSRAAFSEALAPERDRTWARLADRYVQTNDTFRAVSWLWPARLVAGGRPLALLDLGASAGLNLVADHLAAPWTTADGAPLPVVEEPTVVLRWGLDRRPVDLDDPEAVDWLRACVWAGQADRLQRLESSIEAHRTLQAGDAPVRVHVARLEACRPILDRAAHRAGDEALLLAFQSVVRAYLDDEAAFDRTVHDWLARHRGRAVHVELEAAPEGDEQAGRPAALYATAAGPRGIERRQLARCAYHPTEVAMDPEGVAWLEALRP